MKTMRLPKISAWVYRWKYELQYGEKTEKQKAAIRKKLVRSLTSTLSEVEWRLEQKRQSEALYKCMSLTDSVSKWWQEYGALEFLQKRCHEYIELAQSH